MFASCQNGSGPLKVEGEAEDSEARSKNYIALVAQLEKDTQGHPRPEQVRIVDQVLIAVTLEYHNQSAVKDSTLSPFLSVATRIADPLTQSRFDPASVGMPAMSPSLDRCHTDSAVASAASAPPLQRAQTSGGTALHSTSTFGKLGDNSHAWHHESTTETIPDLFFPCEATIRQRMAAAAAQHKTAGGGMMLIRLYHSFFLDCRLLCACVCLF